MKKNINGAVKGYLVATICLSMFASCQKAFDLEPGNVLDAGQAYQNVYDADASVMGVYAKFTRLAKQWEVLNELRGDLMDVTTNADQNLIDINNHNANADNPYANPKAFYSLIIDCNDVLKNFDKMLAEKRMTQQEYNERYSDIGAVRSWLYLQVGIHWGAVPYVTDPIANIDDLKDESKFPKIGFEELLGKTLAFAEALPHKGPYSAGSSLLVNNDGYSMDKVFINKSLVLADLNLWKGNWQQAAMYYKAVMDFGHESGRFGTGGEEFYEYYKIAWHLNNGDWSDIFHGAYNERYQNYENIWSIPFNENFQPTNPFMDMFAASRSYLFAPSAKVIKLWKTETSNTNTVVGDAYREQGSYNRYFNRPQISKFFGDDFNPSDPFSNTGRWVLYRTGKVYLRYAEAANRAGRNRLAYAMFNGGGVGEYFNVPNAGADVTYLQQSDTDPSSPFYMDARMGNYPSYRGPYYRQRGVRQRVSLAKTPIDSTLYFDISKPMQTITRNDKGVVTNVEYNEPTNPEAFQTYLEDNIIREAAEELAFEGNRWEDLLRIALRRKATDPDYLANMIASKFEEKNDMATAAAVRAKLSSEANWYLPFKWK